MDVEKLCRLCGYDLYKPKNIYLTQGLFGKISRHTDLQIRKGDGLSSCICEVCDLKLEMADNFRTNVGEVDRRMKEYLIRKIPESHESRRSAFAVVKREDNNNVTKWPDGDSHLVVRSQRNYRRTRIRRERMRFTERRPWLQRELFSDTVMRNTLMYSYGLAESLVASYRALINRCDLGKNDREFAVPSSVPFSDKESDSESESESESKIKIKIKSDPGDEDDEFAAARCRPLRKIRSVPDEQCPRETARTPLDENRSLETDTAINSLYTADPLNLLRVKRIRPLHEDESGSNSSGDNYSFHFDSNFSTPEKYDDRVAATDHSEEIQDLDYRSSDTSDIESSNEEWTRTISSVSSKASVKISDQQSFENFTVPPSVPNQKNNLDGHDKDRDVATPSDSSDSKCPVCTRVCVNSFGLGVHMRTHMSSKCQICDAPTPTKDKFREHMQRHYIKSSLSPSVRCEVCKNVFKNKTGLGVHMRVHTVSSVPTHKEGMSPL